MERVELALRPTLSVLEPDPTAVPQNELAAHLGATDFSALGFGVEVHRHHLPWWRKPERGGEQAMFRGARGHGPCVPVTGVLAPQHIDTLARELPSRLTDPPTQIAKEPFKLATR